MEINARKTMSAVCALAMLGAGAALASTPASAQAGAGHRYVLRPQALSSSLDRISRAWAVKIRFSRGQFSRLYAPKVDATDPAQAIRQAIAGSDLVVRGNAQSGFVVETAREAERPGGNGDVVVTAVRDEAETNYGVSRTSSSTRDGGDLRSQPQSTTVITGKLIADQQIQTVAEALRNASGAAVDLGTVQGPIQVQARGFTARPLSGGLADPTGLTTSTAIVERIEVLKGPAALLSGSDNLGGAINVVTKKPTAESLLNITGEYASYEDRKFIVDGSTALNPDRTISARLIIQHARSDRNFAGYDGRFDNVIYPAVRFRNSFVDVTLGMPASDTRQPYAPFGIFASPGNLVDLSRRVIGDPGQGIRVQNLRPYVDGTFEVADWLTLVARGQVSMSDTDLRVFGVVGVSAAGTATFLRTSERQSQRSVGTDDYARLKINTFGLRHTISAGVNYSDNTFEDYSDTSAGGSATVANIFAQPQPAITLGSFGPRRFNYTAYSTQLGYYAQDRAEIGPLHVIGAVRKTIYDAKTQLANAAPAKPSHVTATTPQVGVVLDLAKPVSIYANYMKGFIPQFLFDRNNQPLPPQYSENIEAGIKLAMPNDLVTATLSAFRLRQTNLPVRIVGLANRYDVTPGQQSKGVELDTTLQPWRAWQIVGTFSYTEYTVQVPTATSLVVAGQPRYKYSFYTKYTLPSGALRNLGASIGVYGFSSSYANRNARFDLPAQQEVDANLYYRYGPISANFGVMNVMNDTLYGVTTSEVYVPRRTPRTFRLSLTYSFFQ